MLNQNEETKEVGNKDLEKKACLIILEEFAKENHQYNDDEREALEQKALSDGEIDEPMIVWMEKKTLIWGYEQLAIARKHHLPYTTNELSFGTKADCLAWIAEKRMSIPSLSLFQKIEIGRRFAEYWLAKHDKNSPLCNAALQKFGVVDQLAIIAIKAGTSRNTTNKVNRILDLNNKEMIQQCRNGELSIDAAYSRGGDTAEVSPQEVFEAEQKKVQRNQKTKAKEIHILAKYSVKGFAATKVKLDEHGLKFFVLRWNEEHPDNQIDDDEVQKEIGNYQDDKE